MDRSNVNNTKKKNGKTKTSFIYEKLGKYTDISFFIIAVVAVFSMSLITFMFYQTGSLHLFGEDDCPEEKIVNVVDTDTNVSKDDQNQVLEKQADGDSPDYDEGEKFYQSELYPFPSSLYEYRGVEKVEEGYLIYNAVTSNDGKKIAYSIVEDEVYQANRNEVIYKIIVLDKISGKEVEIFESEESKYDLVVPVPVAWSGDDKHVITSTISLVGWSIDFVPSYELSRVSISGGKLERISSSGGVLVKNNMKVVDIENSDDKPPYCRGGLPNLVNDGKVVVRDIGSLNETILLEEKGVIYRSISLEDDVLRVESEKFNTTEQEGVNCIAWFETGELSEVLIPIEDL